MNYRALLLVLGVACFFSTVDAYPQCPAGSVSASYDPASTVLVVTATPASSECSRASAAVSIPGYGLTYSDGCPTGASCNLTFVYPARCWAPGSHTVTATSDCDYKVGNSCTSGPPTTATTTFTVPDPTPSANISVEQTAPTHIRVHMTYQYIHTLSAGLKLEHFLPGGAPDNVYWTNGVTGTPGEWIQDFDTSCWLPGGHRFVLTATSCDLSRTVETTYTMPDETPTISASVVVTAPNTIRVDMPYTFPPAVANHTQHALALHHFKPNGTEDGVYWIEISDLESGSWSKFFDTTCWPTGRHTFKASATTCDRTTREATATYDVTRTVHVSVALKKTPPTTKTALISYQFQDDSPNGRSIGLKFLPMFPATTTTTVLPLQPIGNSPNPIEVDVSSLGASGILRATAVNACGDVAVDDVYYDCDCHKNEAEKTAPRPVRLWDGSMTYSEQDPLPFGSMVFARNYDTLDTADGPFGTGWRSAFSAGLTRFMDGSLDTVTIQTEGERRAAFIKQGAVWTQTWPLGIGAPATLTQLGDGSWSYRESGSTLVRLFRSDGRLSGFDDRPLAKKTLIDYATSGLPQRVYDADGTWSCTITVTGNHITGISVDGRSDLNWQYSYSGSLLQSVTLTGSTTAWRSYEYTNGLLSAVRDAAGNLIESHTYDTYGRAVDSIGATNDITNIEYDLPGSLTDSTITRVTHATGEQTTYEQRFIHGRQQTIATVGGCGSCGSRNTTIAVDEAAGHVLRRQDARGYISSFVYDSSGRLTEERRNDRPSACDPALDANHCRMSPSDLLAATLQATSASTYIDYAYADPVWTDIPTTITAPSVAKANSTRTDTVTLDPSTGVALTRTSSGWISSATAVTVTTTVTLYDGLTPAAFDPGRNFTASWLSLPQPAGRRKKVDGPRTDVSDITTFVYYPIDSTVPATWRGRLAALKNAANLLTTYENYDVFGNATRIVDPSGVATELTYDALGRVLTTTLKGVSGCNTTADPLCATDLAVTRTYSPATGPLASQTDANGNVTTYEYDGRGRLAALSRGPSTSALKERRETTYDSATGLKSMERTLAMESGSWVEKRRESYSYDSLAQLSAQTHADNTSIGYTYDDAGSVATVRDENHTAANTRYAYDPASRLASVHQTLGSGEIATSYVYDVAGNLTSVTDPNGNVTTYGYDDLGRMASQTSPVTGTTTYTYDAAGQLVSTTDANNATTTRAYDALGRATSATSVRSGAATETVTWAYDNAGRLSLMTDPAGSTAYTYDRRGLLIDELRSQGDYQYDTPYRYDAAGNRTAMGNVSYTVDYAGRPLTAQMFGNLITSASYLPFGPLTTLQFANGTTKTMTFDARYRPMTNVLTAGTASLSSHSYGYDAAGNITSITDQLDPTYSRTFAYDDLNRLVTANTGTSLWGPGTYTYDAMGNMLTSHLGGNVQTFTYQGTTPRLAGVTYDAAGNETWGGSVYTSRNQLSTGGNWYDGRGVRVRRTWTQGAPDFTQTITDSQYNPELHPLNTTTYIWDGWFSWIQSQSRQLVWFGDLPVAQYDVGDPLDVNTVPTLRYTFTDHLGTPIIQTDETGAIVWRAEYQPYGTIHAYRAGNPGDQPLRLPGQEYTPQSRGVGDYYNIFRWYRSGWGRYTQADPIGTVFFDVPNRDARNTHLNHLYAYGDGNPETNADPLGLASCCNKAFDDCFGKCIENWRLDYKTPPLFSAVPKRFFPPFRVPYPEQPLTDGLSLVSHFMGGRSTAVGSALRGAGRIISPVATALTVFEGFYDLTVIGECATACKLNPCTDLAWAW